ncbi:hypothetical protein GYA49_06220 [Candidatus Beckwithbacteria bacterium]|nr:hypothetical protein [Candidatus Beckwithbacteria bacterium]
MPDLRERDETTFSTPLLELVSEAEETTDSIGFSGESIAKVLSVLKDNAQTIIGKLIEGGAHPDAAKAIYFGEILRIKCLGQEKEYLPFFYREPLELLQAAGVIDSEDEINDIGASFAVVWTQIPEELRLKIIHAIEKDKTTRKAGAALTGIFEEENYWATGTVVHEGLEEQTPQALSIGSLFIQYLHSPEIAVKVLEEATKENGIIVATDVLHAPIDINNEELTMERIPIGGEETGLCWVIDESWQQTSTGEVCTAHLELRKDVYDADRVTNIVFPGYPNNHQQKLTRVSLEDGRTIVVPWAIQPVPETEALLNISTENLSEAEAGEVNELKKELADILALRDVFIDAWREDLPDLEGEKAAEQVGGGRWDAHNIAKIVPLLKEKEDYRLAVNFDSTNMNEVGEFSTSRVDLALMLAIIKRNRVRAAGLLEKGLLRSVGENKHFKDLEEMFQALDKLVADPTLAERYKIYNPLLMVVIASKDKIKMEKICQAAMSQKAA